MVDEVTAHLDRFLNEDDNTSALLRTAGWFNEQKILVPIPYSKLTFFPSCFSSFFETSSHYIVKALPASVSGGLGLQMGATTPGYVCYLIGSNHKKGLNLHLGAPI